MSPYIPDRQRTPQEDQLTEFMLAGEWERVEQMRESAALEPQEPPVESTPGGSVPSPSEPEPGEPEPSAPDEPLLKEWVSPVEQFEIDAQNAWYGYQDANEAPEAERVANTAEHVEDENAVAEATP